jgi:hypothetical protein
MIFAFSKSIKASERAAQDFSDLSIGVKFHPNQTLSIRLITLNFDSQSPGCKRKMSNKHNLVLYRSIDRNLVEKSRELGFNLSKTFENHLKQLLTQFSNVNAQNNGENGVFSGSIDLHRCRMRDNFVITKA